MTDEVDLAVVGGGIVGLAHALLAAKSGLSVSLIEARGRPTGASIRNFGLITVTGQKRGEVWNMCRRSRDLWSSLAQEAGLPILQRGMVVAAQTEEAEAVIQAFAATEMGEDCRVVDSREAARYSPLLRENRIRAALWSPHELRVEPREAIPAFISLLSRMPNVQLRFGDPAAQIDPGHVRTFSGAGIKAKAIVACLGADLRSWKPEICERESLHLTRLNMLRIRPRPGSPDLATPAISDLTLGRYEGFAALPAAAPLLERQRRDQQDMLDHGIHIIAVRSADGSLILGDSHHPCNDHADDPFQRADVDEHILTAASAFLDLDDVAVVERWTGAYATARDVDMVLENTAPGVTAAAVIGGKGMTMSFGFAEHALNRVLGLPPVTLAT